MFRVRTPRLPMAAALSVGGIVHPLTWPAWCAGTLGMVRLGTSQLLQLQSVAVQLQSVFAAVHCARHGLQVFTDSAA